MIASPQTLRVIIAASMVYAIYLPVALWIGSRFPAPIAPPGAVLRLSFCHKLVPDGFLYTCKAHMLRGRSSVNCSTSLGKRTASSR
jgi:hypothetical protein